MLKNTVAVGEVSCHQTIILESKWDRRTHNKMIEDPEFTREILEYFASDDVDFPANKTVQKDLVKAFGSYSNRSRIQYHLMCAYDNELLRGDFKEIKTMQGVQYNFGYIAGLTAKGGDYIRDSRSKFWGEALTKLKEAGVAVTTKSLLQCINGLISNALT